MIPKTKYEYYDRLEQELDARGITAYAFQEINYGLQFDMELDDRKYKIRIFESKKHGVRCDLSQVKNAEIARLVSEITQSLEQGCATKPDTGAGQSTQKSSPPDSEDFEANPLIGTDESGKGDYFGPLVIAGVYADAEAKTKLRSLGVADSKKLSDTRIAAMAAEIKGLCRHSIVIIGNPKYNELYRKFKNLNRLLAWGHARVIENILENTDCRHALSDQFGNQSLIEDALMSRGREIHLEQRPRAEENVVVAAASILARNAFVEKMKELSSQYEMDLPMGASSKTLKAGKEFVERYTPDSLEKVAKLHFKTTQDITEGR